MCYIIKIPRLRTNGKVTYSSDSDSSSSTSSFDDQLNEKNPIDLNAPKKQKRLPKYYCLFHGCSYACPKRQELESHVNDHFYPKPSSFMPPPPPPSCTSAPLTALPPYPYQQAMPWLPQPQLEFQHYNPAMPWPSAPGKKRKWSRRKSDASGASCERPQVKRHMSENVVRKGSALSGKGVGRTTGERQQSF